MNIRHLEIMEAIAETGSFTGAAKKLFMTQSAVSHAVAELEAKAGTALFERLPKGVAVTPCGRSLLEESRGILIASRNLDRRISHLEEDTPIHVVSSITIASFVLPQILNQFRAVHPKQQIFVRVASAKTVLDILQRGDADIAFWEGTAPKGDFETITLGSYLLRAACSPEFPVPGRSVTLQQLCTYPLLLREQGSAVRDTLDRILAAAEIKAEPVWESVNSLSLAKAAEAGMGITVLPEKLLLDSVEMKRLRFLQIENIEMENQMLVLLHKDKYITKPLQLLLEEII